MGMLGPVVCYQVPRGIDAKDERSLEELKLIAAVLDDRGNAIERIFYDNEYAGPKPVFRDATGLIRIFRENSVLDRKVFAGLSNEVKASNFSVLVADLNALVDCDPFVAAAFLTMNKKWGLQIFSINVDGRQILSASQVRRARSVLTLLLDNSATVQLFLSQKLADLCVEFPEIESAIIRDHEVDASEEWMRLLERHKRDEESIGDRTAWRKSRDPVFKRRR